VRAKYAPRPAARCRGTARLNGLNLTAEQCNQIRQIVIVACGHVVARRASWARQHSGRARPHPRRGWNTRPSTIPPPGPASRDRDHRHLAVRGRRRTHSKRCEAARVAGSTVLGSGQRRRLDYRPRGGWRDLPPRRSGDRVASTRRYVAGGRAAAARAVPRAPAGAASDAGRQLVSQLVRLPELVERALAVEPQVRALAERYANAPNALYLGRGANFPVALEGALKLKEIS